MYILWDLDGTLLPSKQIAHQVWSKILPEFGATVPDYQIFSDDFGLHLSSFLDKHASHIDKQSALKRFLEYQKKFYDEIQFYPYAGQTITNLSTLGFKHAVVSSRGHKNRGIASARSIITNSNFAKFIDAIVTGDDVSNHKPHPESIYLAMKALNAKPGQTIMIGDNQVDILAGKRAGTYTIGINHEQSPRIASSLKNADADAITDNLPSIEKIANRLLGKLN